ncbi:MAG: pyruvate formate lyase family protein [Promethearchaeota archaeon]
MTVIDEEYNLKESSQSLKPFNVQRTCVYDGPGIRTTIFFQGCALRCLWCQNPEMQSFETDFAPHCNYSINDLIEVISRDKDYYFSTNGGVTLSGGEPFLQNPESMIHLLELLKKDNIKITVETCLHAPWKNISQIAPYIDLFLVDLKYVGDDKLHYEYTKQDSKLIHSNIQKLLDLNANIKFRMVMVPHYTDNEANIKATADFLKSINYNTIELMKFHNMYEEKVKRFNLDQEPLEITPQQSEEAVEKGVKLFKKYGIRAENTDLDSKRPQTVFTERVKKIQSDIRKLDRSLCIESAKLKTKFYRKYGFKTPTPIHRAERLAYLLKHKEPFVYPQELLVGTFTSKRYGSQLWEEYHGTLGLMFLYNIHRQKPMSYQISFKDKLYTYLRIFPFWLKHSLIAKVFPKLSDIVVAVSRASNMVYGLNNNLLAIAHFVANYEPILKLGTTGLKEKIKKIQQENPKNNQNFYKGVIIALDGLEVFAKRYADYLADLSKKERNPERRKELEKMTEICNYVPKFPARTFHEALQCITFIHIALCLESYENAISFGRLDQILYPYYKRDKETGLITYEEARELIALFVLKMDELVLTTDGNSFISAYKAVETSSSDQALTFGGLGKDGKDATNDVTYMLLDACALQTYSLDMAARIHKGSPDKYLEKIAELYISGCPLPQLFSDKIYINALLKHYPTTIEDARNYAIVGCVEPTASSDHFGNTDCANVNLAYPLLQAIKGLENDLWNIKFREHVLILITNFVKFLFKGERRISRFITKICDILLKRRDIKKKLHIYSPPSSMDELLTRFQLRLNKLTQSVLTDHQKIEKELRRSFQTPLASSLSEGCLKSGKDVYEGGATFNSSGIQAVGVTDVADSLYAIDEVVFKKKLFTIEEIIKAIDNNFNGKKNQKIKKVLLSVPKFGDDSSNQAVEWVNKVMDFWNKALDSVPNVPRNGRYSAGYYALTVNNRYGERTPALPSGRLKGVPLANSITPHYGMEQSNLFSSLNSIRKVDFEEHAENGTTVTLTVDAALFQGKEGVKKLAGVFKSFLTNGGMMLQPNVVSRDLLLDAYKNPNKYPNLLVRIAGYCAYFNELSEEMKWIIINRTCYSS